MLCRCLASALPRAVCENRGEKSVEDIVDRARLLGKTRVVFIHGKGGKASGMHFARVRAASWEWLEPAVKLDSVRFAAVPPAPPDCVVLKGARSGMWRELLAVEECGDVREAVVATCSKRSLSFVLGREKIIELVFG